MYCVFGVVVYRCVIHSKLKCRAINFYGPYKNLRSVYLSLSVISFVHNKIILLIIKDKSIKSADKRTFIGGNI